MVKRLIDKVYKDYKSAINLTAFQLKGWSIKAKRKGLGTRDAKRNLRLLKTPKTKWGGKELGSALITMNILRRFKRKKGEQARVTLLNNGYDLKKAKKKKRKRKSLLHLF